MKLDMSLPNIIRAFELQKKAAKVGFDWPDVSWGLGKGERGNGRI